jgi:hypothetical protein
VLVAAGRGMEVAGVLLLASQVLPRVRAIRPHAH